MARKAAKTTGKQKPCEVDRMWLEFKRTENPNLRDQLVEHYFRSGMLEQIAGNLQRHCPVGMRVTDDLVSEGAMCLTKLVEAFDLSQGVKFESFASYRLRGAMIDALRKSDEVPRSIRSKERLAKEIEANGISRDDAMAAAGVSPIEKQMLRKVASLDEVLITAGSRSLDRSAVAGPSVGHEGRRNLRRSERFETLTAGLLFEEKLVLWLFYYRDKKMREIGAVLGLSESSISQIHGRAIRWLKRSRSQDQILEGLNL